MKKAGSGWFSRAVRPGKGDAVAAVQREGNAGNNSPAAVGNGGVPEFGNALTTDCKGRSLSCSVCSTSFKRADFSPIRAAACARGFSCAAACAGIVRRCIPAPRCCRPRPSFAQLDGFGPVRPAAALFRRGLQPFDVLFRPFVFRKLKAVLLLLFLPPKGKIPADDLDARPVDGKRVVRATVKQRPVMGNEDEPPLFPRYFPRASRPRASRWLVGSSIGGRRFPQEQGAKQQLCALAEAEGFKGRHRVSSESPSRFSSRISAQSGRSRKTPFTAPTAEAEPSPTS